MNKTKHGVLMSGHSAVGTFSVGTVEGRVLFHTPVEGNITLHKLCSIAQKEGLTHLWVLPHEHIYNDRNVAFLDASDIDWDLRYNWQYSQERLPDGIENHLRSVYGWGRAEDRHAFYIIFVGDYAAWKFARNPEVQPKELFWITAHLEHELGLPLTASPGNTGKKYLESLHPTRKDWFAPTTTQLMTLPFSKAAQSIVWDRKPTPEELAKPYVIKIDKNSAFPRAGVEYKFGVGDITHINNPSFSEAHFKLAGIWRIEVADSGYQNHFLPPTMYKGQEWVTTPVLKRLYDQGHSISILEGWYFPESFHVFQKWATNLWDIRAKYLDGDPRRDAIKQILTDTVGYYRSNKIKEEDVFTKRPDWYAQIVGGNRAIMLQNIESLFRKWDMYPVLVDIDCMVFLSVKPLSELLPDNRETLGAYKYEWQMRVSDAVRDILMSDLKTNMKLSKLNDIAEVSNELI